jgi:hypothetical protein
MASIIPSQILAASVGGRSARDLEVGRGVQLANVSNNIDRIADSVHLGYGRGRLDCRGVLRSEVAFSPHQETVRWISVRCDTSRTHGTFGTKILGFGGIILVRILARDARLTPPRNVASIGCLVPTTRNRHCGIVGASGVRHNRRTLWLAKARVLISRDRYDYRCCCACISTLRTTSRITTREERDSREKNERPCHRSTNLSDTIVARKNSKCKSCQNRLTTGYQTSMSYSISHREISEDFGGSTASSVGCSPTRASQQLIQETACP